MIAFLEFATSGFWTFFATALLLVIVFQFLRGVIVGVVAARSGTPINLQQVAYGKTIVSTVQKALMNGELDAGIARAIARNNQRNS